MNQESVFCFMSPLTMFPGLQRGEKSCLGFFFWRNLQMTSNIISGIVVMFGGHILLYTTCYFIN